MKNKTIVFMFLTVAVLYLIMFRWLKVMDNSVFGHVFMMDRITGLTKMVHVYEPGGWTRFQNAAITHAVTVILYLALGTSLGFLIHSIKEKVRDGGRNKWNG